MANIDFGSVLTFDVNVLPYVLVPIMANYASVSLSEICKSMKGTDLEIRTSPRTMAYTVRENRMPHIMQITKVKTAWAWISN